eukprot:12922348-Prorocentrum_lima.AAC.1
MLCRELAWSASGRPSVTFVKVGVQPPLLVPFLRGLPRPLQPLLASRNEQPVIEVDQRINTMAFCLGRFVYGLQGFEPLSHND